MSDIIMESAISTIVDFEDSVAAVDANDKTAAYENWLGLMRGDLKIEFEKNGKRQPVEKQGLFHRLHGQPRFPRLGIVKKPRPACHSYL